MLNRHDSLTAREGRYFNTVVPQECQKKRPVIGFNVYSFALEPADHQPSGTCNLSRIQPTIILNPHITPAPTNYNVLPRIKSKLDTAKCRIYATNYNVLRIMSGMGGLSFTN